MRTFFALTVFVIACGSPPKKESSIVEGDVPSQCCCKTLPTTAEKEIVPQYELTGRMECSSQHGDCVDEVQCSATAGDNSSNTSSDGVPPPPVIEPSTSSGIGEE